MICALQPPVALMAQVVDQLLERGHTIGAGSQVGCTPSWCRRSRCLILRATHLPPQMDGLGTAFQCQGTDSKREYLG